MRELADIYNANPEGEWDRLTRSPHNSLEFTVFMHHIERFLPSQGLVLDAGGGPGRYTVEFCKRGIDVVLLDLSSACVEFAKDRVAELAPTARERLKEAVVGDVTNLSRFDDETFDTVLCLDPLSCLSDATDRERALRELVRVARTASPVILAVRGFLDVLRTVVRVASHELIDGSLENLLETGNVCCDGVLHHFFRASEIRELAEECGLTTLLQAGGEGLSSAMPETVAKIAEDQAKWERWVEVTIETSTETAVVDTSGHMLYVGHKAG